MEQNKFEPALAEEIVIEPEFEDDSEQVRAETLEHTGSHLGGVIDRTRRLKHDPLMAERCMPRATDRVWTTAGGTLIFAGIVGALSESRGVSPDYAGLLTLGMPLGFVYWRERARFAIHGETGKVTVAEGYGIQSLYATKRSSDGRIKAHDVAVVILPRQYDKPEQEPRILARTRLREALSVSGEAGADKVVIPHTMLARAQAGLQGRGSFKELVQSIAPGRLALPDSDQACAVLSGAAAKELAEKLEVPPCSNWEAVRAALQERYPSNPLFAEPTGDESRLVSTLHTYVYHSAEIDRASSAFSTEQDGPAKLFKQPNDVFVIMDTKSDKFDPLIMLSTASGRGIPGTRRLSQWVAKGRPAEILLHDISQRLAGGATLKELELLYLALQTLKEEDSIEEVEAHSSESEMGQNPTYITYASNKEFIQSNFVRRSLAKMALIGTLFAPVAVFGHDASNYLAEQSSSQGSVGGDTDGQSGVGPRDALLDMWRISPHDLTEGSYYAAETYDTYSVSGKYWTNSREAERTLHLPAELPNTQDPHLSLSQWEDSGEMQMHLPVAVGTRIAAIRVTGLDGKPIQTRLTQSQDGAYRLFFAANQPAYVSYDLVLTPRPVLHATRPIRVEAPLFHAENRRQVAAFPLDLLNIGVSQGLKGIDGYTQKYVYDDTARLNPELQGDSAGAIVSHIDHAKRCNCAVCATEAALVMAAVAPTSDVAYTAGYYHQPHLNYLLETGGHAWITGPDGEVDDGTPGGQGVDVVRTNAELRKLWQTQIPQAPEKFPNPKWPLIAIGGVVLGAIEIRRHYAARFLRWRRDNLAGLRISRSLSPSYSYALMQWAAYAGPESAPPTIDCTTQSPMTPKSQDWQRITQHTLESVAKSGVSTVPLTRLQRRGLRRTARYVLRQHVASEKAASKSK